MGHLLVRSRRRVAIAGATPLIERLKVGTCIADDLTDGCWKVERNSFRNERACPAELWLLGGGINREIPTAIAADDSSARPPRGPEPPGLP
jgi:hypothetical protein